jgi:Rieske Fe-S protein
MVRPGARACRCDGSHCHPVVDRRSVLKGGAGGLLVTALVGGCGSPPLHDPGDAGAGGSSGSGGGGEAGMAGLGGDGGAGGSGGTVDPCSSGALPAGIASEVTAGSLVSVGGGLVVGRDAGGFYAMSSICTHQGCPTTIVGQPPQQFLFCPCHGSEFGTTGGLIRGPAWRGLQHYQLDISPSGALTICVTTPVASNARTPG